MMFLLVVAICLLLSSFQAQSRYIEVRTDMSLIGEMNSELFYLGDSNHHMFKMFMRKQDIFEKSSEEIGNKLFSVI